MDLNLEKMLPLIIAGVVTAYVWEAWIRPRVITPATV